MSRKGLPIDSDELEMALTWRTNEGGQYVDARLPTLDAGIKHRAAVVIS